MYKRQHIDRSILFPMADHIAFAVKRMENKEQISNPLNDDIRVMFDREYKLSLIHIWHHRGRMLYDSGNMEASGEKRH